MKDNDIVLKELNSHLDKLLSLSKPEPVTKEQSQTNSRPDDLQESSESILDNVKQCLSTYTIALKMELTLNPSDQEISQETSLGELEVNHTDFLPEIMADLSVSSESPSGANSGRISASLDYRGQRQNTRQVDVEVPYLYLYHTHGQGHTWIYEMHFFQISHIV